MHDDSRRLVNGEQVIVFEEDLNRAVFCLHRTTDLDAREGHTDVVAERRSSGHAPNRRPVDQHLPVLDPGLDPCPRRGFDVGQMTPEHEVNPAPCVAAIGDECAGQKGGHQEAKTMSGVGNLMM